MSMPTLAEAIARIKSRRGKPDYLGKQWEDDAISAAVITASIKKETTMHDRVKVHDGNSGLHLPGKHVHVWLDAPPADVDPSDPDSATRAGTRSEMGEDPEGSVGPKRILKLNGPASSYSILASADGSEVWLVQHSDIDDLIDEQEPVRTLGARATDGAFGSPMKVIRMVTSARDKAQRGMLAKINKANRKLWATR
jgi:hypothetical protein